MGVAPFGAEREGWAWPLPGDGEEVWAWPQFGAEGEALDLPLLELERRREASFLL